MKNWFSLHAIITILLSIKFNRTKNVYPHVTHLNEGRYAMHLTLTKQLLLNAI